jgi:hypothetical protein
MSVKDHSRVVQGKSGIQNYIRLTGRYMARNHKISANHDTRSELDTTLDEYLASAGNRVPYEFACSREFE